MEQSCKYTGKVTKGCEWVVLRIGSRTYD